MEANKRVYQNGYRVNVGSESYFCSTKDQADALRDAMQMLFGKEGTVLPCYQLEVNSVDSQN